MAILQINSIWCKHGNDRILFAAHEESPGETVELDGKRYKEYFGSASEFQKGEHKNVEGKNVC